MRLRQGWRGPGEKQKRCMPMWSPKPDHPLRRLFAGITEQTFMAALGLADPPLTDYLSELLSRFIHVDAIYRLRHASGRRLEEVAEMMIQAEALHRLRSALTKDHFIDYCEQGKRSYYIASTFEDDPYREEAPVLRRLSQDFELCAYGLNQVRREWERCRTGSSRPPQVE